MTPAHLYSLVSLVAVKISFTSLSATRGAIWCTILKRKYLGAAMPPPFALNISTFLDPSFSGYQ